jgi:hypothetical protein
MRAWLRVRGKQAAWDYTEKKKKELYLRVAVKKLGDEDDEFQFLPKREQLELIVERARQIALDAANEDNEFFAMDAEGNVLDEFGNIDEEATEARKRSTPRFGQEVGETREREKLTEVTRPKTFGNR